MLYKKFKKKRYDIYCLLKQHTLCRVSCTKTGHIFFFFLKKSPEIVTVTHLLVKWDCKMMMID